MKERFKNSQWFRDARFGMFIHWGLYAIPARGEWVKSIEKIPDEVYDRYFDEFNPTEFDPVFLAKTAKLAGMKYAVLTSKHHDGFCLFDSRYTDYKITNTKYKKDAVREFLDAFRAEGLKVGLYYSLLDWHHPDYPAFDDPYHPMRGNPEANQKRDFSKYLEYMHNQIKELVTQYGKLDLMWLDFSYDELKGEKWRATELVNMIRSFQPDILINNRLDAAADHFGGIMTDEPKVYSGDFACPELLMPPQGLHDDSGEAIPWEICASINESWGYNAQDKNFKDSTLIIKKLIEAVSKGGNFILNISPDAKGKLQTEAVETLKKVGEWLRTFGESIYGCDDALLPKPEWGRYTKKGNYIFAHVFERPLGPCLELSSIDKKDIESIVMLNDASEIKLMTEWIAANYPKNTFAEI
ncbi:MAG TPA: alpha-L-fucosidase, partial [Clostridia bacterium]